MNLFYSTWICETGTTKLLTLELVILELVPLELVPLELLYHLNFLLITEDTDIQLITRFYLRTNIPKKRFTKLTVELSNLFLRGRLLCIGEDT